MRDGGGAREQPGDGQNSEENNLTARTGETGGKTWVVMLGLPSHAGAGGGTRLFIGILFYGTNKTDREGGEEGKI